jgi:hypothetical protein
MKPRLSAVIPHWPLDEELDQALRVCLDSLPPDCEKIVVVNEGTGFAVNLNIGLALATGVIERVGLLDERFEGAFFEDNDYFERLRREGIPARQIDSVSVASLRIGLTMSKLPDRGKGWLEANERCFEGKWGWAPPPTEPGSSDD